MNGGRLLRIVLILVLGLGIAGLIAWWTIQQDQANRTAQGGGGITAVAVPEGVSIGGPFALTDHTGAAVTDADYQGKFRLIFFGFTFCPDICPTELQVMAQALDVLGPAAEDVKPLFVTIDPERDTPAQLAEYVSLFDDRITGLTGTPEQIADIARKYRVYYAKAPGDAETYLMDHSTYTYLMGPDGQFLTVFPRGTDAETMAKSIRQFMQGQS
ncbi:SCO family protein [Indioceanicola profundi]|uniref:SCO family protein n=1 Tax=Indioceanicola profundi TaxID=2220096 RepID=UPI000E6ACC0E|nr:SCO family protein [Indioceanicola profundi]